MKFPISRKICFCGNGFQRAVNFGRTNCLRRRRANVRCDDICFIRLSLTFAKPLPQSVGTVFQNLRGPALHDHAKEHATAFKGTSERTFAHMRCRHLVFQSFERFLRMRSTVLPARRS